MAKKRNTYRGGPYARDFDVFSEDLQYWQISPQLVQAHSISDSQLRQEYTRLRAIANKRLKRMQGRPEAQGTIANMPEQFPTVRGMDRAAVVQALGQVSSFLVARRGSLSGIHHTNKQIQKGLAKKGVRVTAEQLAKFGSFMNATKKALGVARGDYASEQLASLWDDLFKKGKISQKTFEKRVKEIMEEEAARRQAEGLRDTADLTRAERIELNKTLRDTPITSFFDELAIDPRTLSAMDRKEKKPADQARSARRLSQVKKKRARR